MTTKITALVLATSAVTLFVACTVFAAYDYVTSRMRLARDVTLLADIVGRNSTAALTFRDAVASKDTLTAMALNAHIVKAQLFTSDGLLLATYERTPDGRPSTGPIPVRHAAEAFAVMDGGFLYVSRPIRLGEELVGSLSVVSDTAEIWTRLGRYAAIVAVTLFGAFWIAFGLSRITARLIYTPIARLIDVARLVRDSGRYDVRALKGDDDEIGELTIRFNEMLSEIQRRDERLLVQQTNLESTVTSRTAELLKANTDLEVARDRAMDASRAKGEFLANMSHEIRTPMNGIIGMTDLLLQSPMAPDQRDSLTTLRSSAESLLAVLNDILDFSKIEARRLRFESVPFSVRRTVADAFKPFSLLARQKGLAFTSTISADVPPGVVGDPGRLRQVLVNILSNAIKFTAQGQVSLAVTVDHLDHSHATLHVRVNDTGIGIPADQQQAIFEAFRQADGSTTRRFGGTGLGLTISSALVQQMGGRLWVESTPQAGSTFHCTMTLELARTDFIEIDAPSPDPAAFSTQPAARAARVLLVEDNVVNRQVASGLLKQRGHHVTLASNGAEALERLQHETFDVVLMDLQMPVMGGIEATLAIRQREAVSGGHIPIIAITAYAMTSDRDRCQAAGMDGYLSKPVEPDLLFAAVETPGQQSPLDVPPAPAVTAGLFDPDALLHRARGDRELMASAIRVFVEDCPARLAAIENAWANRDLEGLRAAAHAIKGAAANLSAAQLSEAARALEMAAAEGQLEAAGDAWHRVSAEAARLLEVLQ